MRIFEINLDFLLRDVTLDEGYNSTYYMKHRPKGVTFFGNLMIFITGKKVYDSMTPLSSQGVWILCRILRLPPTYQ